MKTTEMNKLVVLATAFALVVTQVIPVGWAEMDPAAFLNEGPFDQGPTMAYAENAPINDVPQNQLPYDNTMGFLKGGSPLQSEPFINASTPAKSSPEANAAENGWIEPGMGAGYPGMMDMGWTDPEMGAGWTDPGTGAGTGTVDPGTGTGYPGMGMGAGSPNPETVTNYPSMGMGAGSPNPGTGAIVPETETGVSSTAPEIGTGEVAPEAEVAASDTETDDSESSASDPAAGSADDWNGDWRSLTDIEFQDSDGTWKSMDEMGGSDGDALSSTTASFSTASASSITLGAIIGGVAGVLTSASSFIDENGDTIVIETYNYVYTGLRFTKGFFRGLWGGITHAFRRFCAVIGSGIKVFIDGPNEITPTGDMENLDWERPAGAPSWCLMKTLKAFSFGINSDFNLEIGYRRNLTNGTVMQIKAYASLSLNEDLTLNMHPGLEFKLSF